MAQQQHYSDDRDGEVPLAPTDAEITLRKLLDKQLSTTTSRLEQVDFQEATESMRSVGYGCSGVASLSEFLKNEVAQKELADSSRCLRSALLEKGYSKGEVEEKCQRMSCIGDFASLRYEKEKKRKRYGADPLFVTQSKAEELEIAYLKNKYSFQDVSVSESSQTGFGRHAKELEDSLLRGKDKLQAIAHLSGGGSSCRKPLGKNMQLENAFIGMSPQDRARNEEVSRTAAEVFCNRVPELLDLHTYLDQRQKEDTRSHDVGGVAPEDTYPGSGYEMCTFKEKGSSHMCKIKEVSEEEIVCNRLSMHEIQNLPSGKFTNYSPGNPSHVLYIKNLSRDVMEEDLIALFLRYQTPGRELLFRLMQQGRMKGQAFITFPDELTAASALQLLNGYKLKGRPMIIEFGNSCQHV